MRIAPLCLLLLAIGKPSNAASTAAPQLGALVAGASALQGAAADAADTSSVSVEQAGARPAALRLPTPPALMAPSSGGGSARQLAACDLQALVQPAAVPSLAGSTSALFGTPCSGLSGYTFSALMRNPNNADVAIYLGVGQAQCSAGCV